MSETEKMAADVVQACRDFMQRSLEPRDVDIRDLKATVRLLEARLAALDGKHVARRELEWE